MIKSSKPSRVLASAGATFALALAGIHPAQAAVLFTDNFNIADTNSLDGSDQIGRHTGLLASDVLLRSGGVQQTIIGGQLNVKTADPSGRVRFQPSSLAANTLFDFASGASGTSILADGGMRVEFDWTPDNNTNANSWLSLSVGYTGFDTNFNSVRVNQANNDFGIIFRNNGAADAFDNGAGAGNYTFNVSGGAVQRHATVDFLFGSFADGSAVTVNSYVDGVLIGTNNITWDGNGGSLFVEFGNFGTIKTMDNISISTAAAVPEPASFATLAGLAGLAFSGLRRRRAAA